MKPRIIHAPRDNQPTASLERPFSPLFHRQIIIGTGEAMALWGLKVCSQSCVQPREVELVVNVTTAKALGLDVPTSLLARANEVIE